MEWISVKDRLPEFHEDCWFTNINVKRPDGSIMKPNIQCGFYFEKGKFKSWVDPRDDWNATHWLPIPPLSSIPKNF